MITLKKNEKLEILQKWNDSYHRSEEATDQIRQLFNDPSGILYDAIWDNFKEYTDVISMLLGDEFGFLKWFQLDCDMGKKLMKTEKNCESKFIKNLDDLLWIIEK